MADSDEDYYEVPLRDQRYFGAGIKRRRVNFVPATTSLDTHGPAPMLLSVHARHVPTLRSNLLRGGN